MFITRNALQRVHAVAERVAHPADLAVDALHQDDAKGPVAGLPDAAGQSRPVQDLDARSHAAQEILRYRLGQRHPVLLFVAACGAQDAVDDAAVVVKRIRPLESLSSRPMGNTRSG
jgi:hypothetical protein